MITICNEEYQEKYNITNGCWCCGTKELTEDIKEVQFVPGSMSKTITLCKKCRVELLTVLKDNDDAEIHNVSDVIETKEIASKSFDEENIYAKDMNAGVDVSKVIEAWETEPNDVIINEKLIDELLTDEEIESNFDVDAWVNSLIEQNEKEKAKVDTKLASIVSNAVEKVLNPEIPETVAGQKLPMLTVARINPVVYMCKNCEMDFDDEDVEFAKETGDCPYCNVDLTEEYDPDAMLVGRSSLHRL